MGYADGEALLLTRIQALDYFGAANTARGDWKILNSGNDDHYAILRRDNLSIEWITFTDYVRTWTTIIEVWQRYVDDSTTQSDLYTHASEIFDVMAYPHLGDSSTVLDSSIDNSPAPVEKWTKDGGPKWLSCEIVIRWKEQTSVTFQE